MKPLEAKLKFEVPDPFALSLLSISALFLAGCGESAAPDPGFSTPMIQRQRDDFAAAMSLFQRRSEFDTQQVHRKILDHLNRWIKDQPPDNEWIADPLVNRLPSPIRNIEPLSDLGKLHFQPRDIEFLQEAAWMHDVAQSILRRPKDAAIAPWLEFGQPDDSVDANPLELALRIFDWTIRHVQLDKLRPIPDAPQARPVAPSESSKPSPPPAPMRAVPGPGYTLYPWQALMFGHGDAWQRALVFIQLARQMNIDVVILAIDDGADPFHPRPWLPAVVLNDRLYLFDAALGLPISGPDGAGVATFDQVRADPNLLRALDMDREHPYPITAADLEKVVALLDASPGFLSQRMKLVESHLTGDMKMVLTGAPSKLARKLREFQGIQAVRLWTVPYETILYRTALENRIREDRDAWFANYVEEGIFWGSNPLVLGRLQHVRGILESQDEQPGAMLLYLEARIPDEVIDRIQTSSDARDDLGFLSMLPQDPVARSKVIENSAEVLTRIKRTAGYWLGLAHYDSGNYGVAINWLKQTRDVAPDGTWSTGASYNLARTFEAMGDWQQARQIYLADDSPQQHGNHLRARLLKPLAEKEP